MRHGESGSLLGFLMYVMLTLESVFLRLWLPQKMTEEVSQTDSDNSLQLPGRVTHTHTRTCTRTQTHIHVHAHARSHNELNRHSNHAVMTHSLRGGLSPGGGGLEHSDLSRSLGSCPTHTHTPTHSPTHTHSHSFRTPFPTFRGDAQCIPTRSN